mmetsp:Transcript_44941/g.79643  ORF Transcript_44941/g.79643 Transcript_44941/m.79643 type:complete len:422 (+) Transcript_44941:148-1413(+)
MDEVVNRNPSPKRRRVQDENMQPPGMGNKEVEQNAGIAAADVKKADLPAGLTEDQRLRIERNRMLALQRKQQRQVVEPTASPQAPSPTVAATPLVAAQLAGSHPIAQPTPRPADVHSAVPHERASPQTDEQMAAQPPAPAIQPDLSIMVAEVMDELGEAGNQDSTTSSSSDDSDSSSDDGSSSSDSSSEDSSSTSSSSSEEAEVSCPPGVKAAPTSSLTDEQRERIERNRQAAMERKRRLQEAPATPRPIPAKTAATPVKELEYTPAEERDGKQKLVAQLLCRWWYVLPEWPPKGFDYEKELARRLLRCVPIEQWDTEPELDSAGLRKVYALSQFPGRYRNSAGMLLDLRPVEGRPSYDRFITKSVPELYRLLLVAYRNQLMDAKAQGNLGPTHKAHVEELQKRISEVRGKAMFAMTFIKK